MISGMHISALLFVMVIMGSFDCQQRNILTNNNTKYMRYYD